MIIILVFIIRLLSIDNEKEASDEHGMLSFFMCVLIFKSDANKNKKRIINDQNGNDPIHMTMTNETQTKSSIACRMTRMNKYSSQMISSTIVCRCVLLSFLIRESTRNDIVGTSM
jgi:hypothetical protein